jgi:hypothetical protein
MASAWTRSLWTDAGLLASDMEPDAEVPEGARGVAPHEWHATLVAGGKWAEAISFLAHALPRYECVVWATRALLEAGAIERSSPATVAVLRWIDGPSDQLRREVNDAVQGLRNGSAAKMLGQAVFYSGGSVAPPDMPHVQVPTQACARMITAALVVGLLKDGNRMEPLQRALRLGEQIAAGQG